jgi:hypothetical protein
MLLLMLVGFYSAYCHAMITSIYQRVRKLSAIVFHFQILAPEVFESRQVQVQLVEERSRHVKAELRFNAVASVHPIFDTHDHVHVHQRATCRRACKGAVVDGIYCLARRKPRCAVLVRKKSGSKELFDDSGLKTAIEEALARHVELC